MNSKLSAAVIAAFLAASSAAFAQNTQDPGVNHRQKHDAQKKPRAQ